MMFNDMNHKHLKPLSKYAHGLFNEPVAHTSVHQFKPPNNSENDGTKTTAVCRPGVGCFVEGPSLRKDPVACEGRQSVDSVLGYVDSPHSFKCRPQNVALSFDLDVDDILNLSPCGDSLRRVLGREKKRKLDVGGASLHQGSAAPVDVKGMCPSVTTMESPLQVKVSKPQKDDQRCAFRSTCSQTACLFFNLLFLVQVRSVVIKVDSYAPHSSCGPLYTTRGSPPPV